MAAQDARALCARNNAELCDSVCRSHGVPGQFSADVWLQPRDGPAYYPNAVTLSASGDGIAAQIERLSAARPNGFSVKDSFDQLDLSEFGLRRLFRAEWVWLESDPPPAAGGTGAIWKRIGTDGELQAFEAAWSAGNPPHGRIFLPQLLEDATVSLLAARRDGRIVAGCIANRGPAGVTGFSNFFAPQAGRSAFRAEAVLQLRRMDGGAIAGYDNGEELAGLLALGFRAVGSLAVWTMP
ncbi:hypothetical protein [Mesorhizobium sp. ZC-5]|uniref:hypothetical protein n=1 Tax=Mesorhizobium sp. ZC-5 TaxID=2986066 RepID=UPI0021E8E632|nr:hypothetical protein [Mesorhizobium sp. ZC-5]MCV3238812.1 hypothetical protein [Mesorhizobium sp. ZC-5]